jgi:hypothetical protein
VVIQSWEPIDIDSEHQGYTLRSIVMSLKAHGTEHPLFLSMDHTYNNPTKTLFACLPRFESEARTVVANLHPFLKHYLPINIDYWFTADAIHRGGELVWDPITQEFISSSDNELDALVEFDDDTEFFGLDEDTHMQAPALHEAANHISAMLLGDEQDTIESIGHSTTTSFASFPIAHATLLTARNNSSLDTDNTNIQESNARNPLGHNSTSILCTNSTAERTHTQELPVNPYNTRARRSQPSLPSPTDHPIMQPIDTTLNISLDTGPSMASVPASIITNQSSIVMQSMDTSSDGQFPLDLSVLPT